jgi:hypothetical protein
MIVQVPERSAKVNEVHHTHPFGRSLENRHAPNAQKGCRLSTHSDMELQERPSLGSRLQRTAPRMMVLVSFVPLADMAKEAIGSLDLRLRANLNRDRTDNERNKAASQGKRPRTAPPSSLPD